MFIEVGNLYQCVIYIYAMNNDATKYNFFISPQIEWYNFLAK